MTIIKGVSHVRWQECLQSSLQMFLFFDQRIRQSLSAKRLTFTTRSASLAVGDGLLPLCSFASTAFLCCTRCLVLFGVAAGVFVDDVVAHVERLLEVLEAHVEVSALSWR